MIKTVISADSPLTSAAGADIARAGGNAVDVAVAAALAATVSEVLMCSLGGSAFFMVGMAGKPCELIEGADAAPTQPTADRQRELDRRQVFLEYGDGLETIVGHASIAVPGMLAAAETAWKRHGRLPWAEIVAPAIELARGQTTGRTLANWLMLAGRALHWEQPASRAAFFNDDEPLGQGDLLRINNLSRTMEVIAEKGASAFYQGELAEVFTRDILEHGGLVTLKDLASYRAQVRKPVKIHSRGFELALNPQPAVGGASVGYLIRALEANWHDGLSAAEKTRLMAWSQARLFGYQANDFTANGFDDRAAQQLLNRSGSESNNNPPHTTHLSVAASDGSLVAVTMSMGYGSGVVIPELGIACNNSLGEPELNPAGYDSMPARVRFTSNMAPTLAWRADGSCIAIGSPGASRIPTAIAQTWVHAVLDGQSYEDAVAAPRLHVDPCDGKWRVQHEPGLDTDLLASPFVLRPFKRQDRYFGGVKVAGLDQHGQLLGIADLRREGAVQQTECPG